jgi:hypothetical protein
MSRTIRAARRRTRHSAPYRNRVLAVQPSFPRRSRTARSRAITVYRNEPALPPRHRASGARQLALRLNRRCGAAAAAPVGAQSQPHTESGRIRPICKKIRFGWRLGRIIDPCGHEWEIGVPLGAWPQPKRRAKIETEQRLRGQGREQKIEALWNVMKKGLLAGDTLR